MTSTAHRFLASASAGEVSALLDLPPDPGALLVLGHGAGAPMVHPFMGGVARRLSERGVAVFRYAFPYMEKRSRRPDPAPLLVATVASAFREARALVSGVPAFAGGKSLGGRMTSTAASEGKLDGLSGLVFLGFPLHRPGRPSSERAEHLARVAVPTLFLQGTRDDLADLTLIREVVGGMGPGATLHVVEGADHGFHVLKRSGRADEEVLDELADEAARWMADVAPSATSSFPGPAAAPGRPAGPASP